MANKTPPSDNEKDDFSAFNVNIPTALTPNAKGSRQQVSRRQINAQNSHVFNVPKAGKPRSEHHGAARTTHGNIGAATQANRLLPPRSLPSSNSFNERSATQPVQLKPTNSDLGAIRPNATGPSPSANAFKPPPTLQSRQPAKDASDDALFAPMTAWTSGPSKVFQPLQRTNKFGTPGFTAVNSQPGKPGAFAISQPSNAPKQSRPAAGSSIFSSGNTPFDPYRAPSSHNFIDLTTVNAGHGTSSVVDIDDYMDQDEANEKLKNLLEGNLGGDEIEEEDDANENVDALAKGLESKLDLQGKTDAKPEKDQAESTKTTKVKATVDDGERAGLKVKLLPHQIAGVKWMIQKEVGTRRKTSSHPNGGILADDMGLGKTLQTIATIVTNPRPAKDSEEAKKRRIKTSTSSCTLIVVPLPLLQQWQGEIGKFVDSDLNYKVHVHYGPRRHTTGETMKKCHVVLSTYETLVSDYSNSNFTDGGNRCAAFDVDWYRVVLDEAHRIKNPSTKQSKACCALTSHYRWCLTGTPMQNKLEEIQTLIKFLSIEPYNNPRHWKDQITNPMAKGRGGIAMKRVQILLKAILLRRTKDLLREKGELQTVGRQVIDVVAEFAPDERTKYEKLEDRMADTIDRMGSGLKYTHALVLLLRLRQACNHLQLVNTDISKDKDALMTGNATSAENTVTNQEVDDLASVFDSLGVGDDSLGESSCKYCGNTLTKVETESGKACDACNRMLGVQVTPKSSSSKNASSKRKLVRGKGSRQEEYDGGIDASLIAQEEEEEKQHAMNNSKQRGTRDLDSDEDEEGGGEWLVSRDEQTRFEASDEDESDDGESLGESDSDSDDDTKASSRRNHRDTKQKVITIDSDNEASSGPEFEDEHLAPSSKQQSRRHRTVQSDSDDSEKGSGNESESLVDVKMTPARARNAPFTPQKLFASRSSESSLTSSAKIRELMKILGRESKNHKIIVFSSFVTMLRMIEPFLLDAGLRYVHYNGQMKNDERENSLDSLRNDKKIRVLLCSLKSGALGLNLTAASRVVLIEPFWNPFVEEQAIDRVHRIGQKHDVIVYKLTVGETIEQRIVALQEKKRELAKMALESGRKTSGAGALTMEQVLALFRRDAEYQDHQGGQDDQLASKTTSLLKSRDADKSSNAEQNPRLTAKPHRPGYKQRVEDPIWGRR